MNIKKEDSLCCYRCGEKRCEHLGDELRCRVAPRKTRYAGDGCFKSKYKFYNRVALSLTCEQAEFLDRLLTMMMRSADVSILVRSEKFAPIKRIIATSSARARTRRENMAADKAANQAASEASLRQALVEFAAKQKRPLRKFCRNNHEYNRENTTMRVVDGYETRVCKSCVKNRAAKKYTRELKQRQEAALERMVEERRVG